MNENIQELTGTDSDVHCVHWVSAKKIQKKCIMQ